jgi:MFS family permease
MKYAQSVSNAIISAYYPRVTAAADAARSRAQSASAIASAIAGGLLGAGLVVNLATTPAWERLLGAAALFFWLFTSVLYIRAVASPVLSVSTTQLDSDAFVDAVLENARAERQAIDHRQKWATWLSFIAMALTTATVLGFLLIPRPQERVSATLSLSGPGAEALGRLCTNRPTSISGMLDPASLDSRYVIIAAQPGACKGRVVELHISSEQVLGAARTQQK